MRITTKSRPRAYRSRVQTISRFPIQCGLRQQTRSMGLLPHFLTISRFPIQCGLRHLEFFQDSFFHIFLSVAFQFSADYDYPFNKFAITFYPNYQSLSNSVRITTLSSTWSSFITITLSVAFQFSADYDIVSITV